MVLDNGHLHNTKLSSIWISFKRRDYASFSWGWSSYGITRRCYIGFAPSALENTDSDYNNNSLVFMLEYQGVRMLFTGDLERVGQWDLLERGRTTFGGLD